MAANNSIFRTFFPLFLSLLFTAHEATCIPSEREALLRFKKALHDPSDWLSSWTGHDCCQWTAVTCHPLSGHVTQLNLKSPDFCADLFSDYTSEEEPYTPQCLTGELSPYLVNLRHLQTLDLSSNNFNGISIPTFLGSMKSLRYLDLSLSSFSGRVPSTLGNLSNLQYLDLTVDFYSGVDLWVSDLNWLPPLSNSLNYLKLTGVNLKRASHHWSEKVNSLSSLLELNLIGCQLTSISDVVSTNLTSLSIIDISENSFNSSLPQWIFNIGTAVELKLGSSGFIGPVPVIGESALCKLRQLDLSFNNLTGEISGLVLGFSGCPNKSLEKLDLTQNLFTGKLPQSLGDLKYLRSLQLSQNSFSGLIPGSLRNLARLEVLELSWNKINGTIPESIGQLRELSVLSLLGNSWEGTVTEVHFRNMSKLSKLAISLSYKNYAPSSGSGSGSGSLKIIVSPNWVPGFNLKSIELMNVHLGSAFPEWLKTQKNLSTIVLSRAGISGPIPEWLWKLSPQIQNLNLRENQLRGKLPSHLNFPEASVELGSNLLEGHFPTWSGLYKLSLRNNLLSGLIPTSVGRYNPRLTYLDAANNSLIGPIPPSISKLSSLKYLDLSQNSLSGTVFLNWTTMNNLKVLDLSRNDLSGEIPSSMCSNFPSLEWLKLSNNKITGKLSNSALNCTQLYTIDLGENELQGLIPSLTDSISELLLRSNNFIGNFPDQLCSLPNLHILDISDNGISGSIPKCIGNMVGMKSYGKYYQLPLEFQPFYLGDIELNLKDRRMPYKYNGLVPLVNFIDLSSNNLSGEIPTTVTDLSFLGTLNLSRNRLSGKIPEKISSLKMMETLDLSWNHLSGNIPMSMGSMSFLSHFNVSYNDLSGQVPSQGQLQTFEESSFEGNVGLCGPPLLKNCLAFTGPEDGESDQENDEGENKDDLDKLWIYVCTIAGFLVGFWSVCGSLAVKTSWRHGFFRFVDRVNDRFYVFVAVNVRAKLCRKEKEPRGNQSVPDFVLHPSLPSIRQ